MLSLANAGAVTRRDDLIAKSVTGRNRLSANHGLTRHWGNRLAPRAAERVFINEEVMNDARTGLALSKVPAVTLGFLDHQDSCDHAG